ncbi:MAG: type II toxin-antitoxin system PemK/MazF family toxin [Hyphomicrobiaceae bacterium]
MQKDFDRWNDRKKEVDHSTFRRFRQREREVWWCTLGVNVGSEQDGSQDFFERPVLVVRKFNKDTVLIVPLTSSPRRTPYHIAVRHQGTEFVAVVSQLRLISTKRLARKIYQMDRAIFAEIVTRIRAMLPRV